LAEEYGITQLQILGYSLLVIQWLRKEASFRNFTLQPLFDDIQQQMTTFSHISKEALGLEQGTWTKSIFQDQCTNDFSHAPWL
jgi:hypothetical protein